MTGKSFGLNATNAIVEVCGGERFTLIWPLNSKQVLREEGSRFSIFLALTP